jgi:NAD(P)H-flavin reductase
MAEAAVQAYQPVPVLDAWDETPALRGVQLDLGPSLARSHTVPGQVVKLRSDVGEGYFAIASAPWPDGKVELLLKRGATLADSLIALSQPGASVEATAPFGKGFPVEKIEGRDVLLFAAGSGISPIRALTQHILAKRDTFGRAALFYGQRTHQDFAYTDEHAAWDHGGVKVVLCSSQAAPHWQGERGYVQDVARSLEFLKLDTTRAVAFLCGMKTMVSGVREVLERAGVTADRTFQNF